MKILVINAGSSSLKYQLMDPNSGEVFAKGLCERIGIDGRLTHKVADKKIEKQIPMPTHGEAIAAVMDALLGALALGDIGHLFPDNDPAYKDADSIVLLQKLLQLPQFRTWQLVNADLTILAQKPKIAPYIREMQQNLATALNCAPEQISIKATTTEKLGFCGREEGIAASAVVLLTQI